MRTPGERTSGAWTGGCVIHPDGGDETDRTAGNSYTATPHNTQMLTAQPGQIGISNSGNEDDLAGRIPKSIERATDPVKKPTRSRKK